MAIHTTQHFPVDVCAMVGLFACGVVQYGGHQSCNYGAISMRLLQMQTECKFA